MGIHLTDILLFGKAVESSVDSGTFRIYRRNILRWGAISHAVDVVVHGVSPLSLPDAVADGLKYVKAYGDCENRNLPKEYQEIEYIEGHNNAQYINTGIVPTSSMSMYFKGQFVSVDASTPTQVAFLAGARDVGGQYGFFLQLAPASVGLDWFVVNGRWTENHTRANGDIVEMRVNNSLAQIWLNGTSVGTHQYTPDDTTQYPIFLNGLNSVGQPFDSNVNVVNRIYRFTIDGICDMRPARRLSDGVLGMYDTVRKRFFTNAGSGSFIAGNVVALPEGYTKLGFLQTTKTPSQCYFDTGKNFNSNYTYEVSFMKGGNANAVLGARVGAYNAKGNFAVTYVTNTAVYSSTSSASTAIDMGDTTLDEKHTVRYCQRDSLLTWDGADKWRSGWINSESIPYNIYLFGMNQENTVQGSRSGYLRIYTYKVYDGNGILIQDLVPAIRNSDNAMGLYDTVADEFLLAKGSSIEFTGSPVYTPTPTAPQDIWSNNGAIKAIRPIKYLESTGTQYIDTGIQFSSYPFKKVITFSDVRQGSGAASLPNWVNGSWANDSNNRSGGIGLKTNGKIGLGIGTTGLGSSPYEIDNPTTPTTVNIEVLSSTSAKFTGGSTDYNSITYSGGALSGYTDYLFGPHFNGASSTWATRVKIYGAKYYDNGVLVRDFIPALDANNIPCMFDKVEGKCYYNAGTGQFVAGYLPAEYEELEYIQGYCSDSSDSTIKASYIDTGIILPANANFYLKSQLASSPTTNSYLMCGTRTEAYAGSEIYVGSTNTVIDWYGSTQTDRLTINDGGLAGDMYEIYGNNKTLTVFKNGSNLGSKTFSSPTTPTLTFWLNSRNTNNQVTPQTAPTLGRIYRFKVAGVCDMIPARKRSNGHIGMYDLIRRQFFENAGEGQFTVGKLPVLPETYTQLDYIESTGTQYLNTGVANNQAASYDITVQATQAPETGRAFLVFGSRNSATVANITSTLTSTNACSDFGDYNSTRLNPTIDSPLHKLRFVNSATNRTITDLDTGTVYSSTSAYTGTFSGSTTLRIGQVTTGGATTWDNFVGKIFECKVYQNDVLVKYLIPAKRNSDGVVGMYDITNDVFHTNEGTGEFAYGSEIPDNRESYYYVDGLVEKVGTRSAGNKNLFNGVFEQGGLFRGILVDADTRIRTPDYLTFPAGTYTISCASAYEVWVENNDIPGNAWYSSYTFTVTSTGKIKIAVRSKTDPATTVIRPDDPVNVQIEAGSTVTAYVPYCDGGLAVCENLLGIGSTQDVQEILTGTVTRKFAVVVLDGSEVWVDLNNQHQMYQTPAPNTVQPSGPADIVSTHFVSSTEPMSSMPNHSAKFAGAGAFPDCGLLMFKETDFSGVSQWTAWLRQQYDNGTPVVVVYPLSADETETVAGQTLTVSAGNNTAEIMQASIDELELEVKYTKTNN